MQNPFVFSAIGVDISDESFKFVRLHHRNKNVEIDFFGNQDLPAGIIEAGEIKKREELIKALSDALGTYRRKAPYVILSMPEEKGFVRLIQMQKIKPEEVRGALEFQLEEHIPVPPQDLIFDCEILDLPSQKQNEMSIVVMAYPRAIIESYTSAVRGAGFMPIILEMESQAIARVVVPRDAKGAYLVGDIGHTRTTFSLVYNGVVHFASTVKMGGRDLDAILKNSLHLTDEEAREVKIGRGFDFSSEDIIKSLSPALTAIKDEADRQIGFWESKYPTKEQAVRKVFLCGGDAHLKGLTGFLSRELRVPTERAHIGDRLFDLSQYIPPMHEHMTLRYATAFGLAMRSGDVFKEAL